MPLQCPGSVPPVTAHCRPHSRRALPFKRQHGIRRALAALGFLLALPFAAPRADAAPQEADTIRAIVIHGNRVTKERTIRAFMTLDTGMTYDSASAAASKDYLQRSGLFSKVDIFPQPVEGGIKLLVIVSERMYWTVSQLGGEIKQKLYGSYVERFWWIAHMGIAYTNFRGVKERLDVRVSFWKSRAATLIWRKPFLGTPYYVALAASVSYCPDLHRTFDRFNVAEWSTLGRKMGRKSVLYGTLNPRYENMFWTGRDGTWVVDSACDTSTAPASCTYDSSWISYEQEKERIENRYSELFTKIGWNSDFRDHWFDTHKGVLFATSLMTNAAYPRQLDYTYAYVQLDTDIRLFHRGIFESNVMAYRLRTTMRLDSAASYDGLYAGGETTLRGYAEGDIPYGFTANNRVLFSTEYRFPIVQTPRMGFPLLSRLYSGLRGFYYRVDGAVLFDGAYLWHYLPDLQEPRDRHMYGYGAGLGMRIMAPTLRRSVSLDVAWALEKEEMERRKQPGMPVIYLYLDMPF
ncbi:MAG: BamA/TamA family outer membrane protein [Chitinivibrionales bacterium]|nr:BamA/TamA family outer membrane protein [Chitinivibrionales bacterium]MBD3397280.1 BamA/TamA family outer membrane protein [Chitinivibrionales bacterium]